MVSSIETLSTQSKVSFAGRLSRQLAERLRILIAISSRCTGVNIGATVLRCGACRGSSIVMNNSNRVSTGLRMLMPPIAAAEENTPWLVSTAMMSLYLVTDQYGPNMLSLQ